jgi:hypothetical protein
MKKSLPLITILLFLVVFSFASAFEVTATSKSLSARVTFLSGEPVKGTNGLRIDITDISGRPAKNASVKVEYLMPSLPGKKPMMDYRTDAKPVGSSYEASLNLTMTGEWKVVLTVTRGERTEQMSFGMMVK